MTVTDGAQHKAPRTAPGGMLALGRLKAGAMNKTEAEYGQLLERLKASGDVLWYRFEGVKLRLADATFYSPDFAVMRADGRLQMVEVKGFMLDDANVKLKVAAGMYPFEFLLVRKRQKSKGGGWNTEAF